MESFLGLQMHNVRTVCLKGIKGLPSWSTLHRPG